MSRIDRDDLATCVDELIATERLLGRVHALMPNQDAGSSDGNTHRFGKRPAAPTPWNDQAADLYLEIHEAVRRTERGLRIMLGHRVTYRGSTFRDTAHVLYLLPDLIAVAAEKDPAHEPVMTPAGASASAQAAAKALVSWPRRCRALLDEARDHEIPWSKAPGDLRCPYCDAALMLKPGWAQIENPDLICRKCTDAGGHAYSWPAGEHFAALLADEEITGAQARERYGLGRSTLRVWQTRGRIRSVGTDSDGANLYRVSDIVQLIDTGDLTA